MYTNKSNNLYLSKFFELYKFNSNINTSNLTDYYSILNINKSINNISIIKSTFINDVVITNKEIDKEILSITGITGCCDDTITTEYCAQFPLFFINKNIIKIPSKVEYVLRKYTSKKLLKEINSDVDVAVELCLLFITQLTSTYFERLENPESEGWKSLHAKYIREFLCIDPMTYKKVTTALEQSTSKGVIIECDHKSVKGQKNFNYRLGEAYIGKGIVSYKLKTNIAQKFLNKHFLRIKSKTESNPIIKNLIIFYGNISLPTIDQIKKEGDRLIELNYKTKKGKLLKKLGNHNRDYFKNPKQLSFVEDSIKVFKYLTENGLKYPKVGNAKNGGRIIDSFTLMPSWIRSMVEVKGNTNVECDYTCLHPNLSINIYSGSKEYITHGDLALEMNTDVDIIKVEHLSFFNKKVWQMKQSPLYPYYEKNEPNMLRNVIAEKYNSELKHNITSRRLFAKEVEIMTEVIIKLNQEGIYVGYVYDALFCHPNDANRVKEVMDTIILKHGVKTTAKLSNGKKHNPFVVRLKDTKYDLNSLKLPKPKNVDIEEGIRINANLINFNLNIIDEILRDIKDGKIINFEDAIIVFDDGYTYKDRVLKFYDYLNPSAIYVVESHIVKSA